MSAFHDGIAARTVWGESRGESDLGKLAVACVIRNRIKSGRWGKTPAAVCLAPYQFSCWMPRDPNFRKMLDLDENDLDLAKCSFAWASSDAGVDPTMGALHYLVKGTPASWEIGHEPAVTIGHHAFYVGIK